MNGPVWGVHMQKYQLQFKKASHKINYHDFRVYVDMLKFKISCDDVEKFMG